MKSSVIDNDYHPDDQLDNDADPDHWGTQMAEASVQHLHPPGVFAKNTQIGDVVNGLASSLNVKPPKNIIKLPSRK